MAEATFSLALHVLGPPLTFALSQDQTLRRKFRSRSTLRMMWVRPGDSTHAQRGMVSFRTRTRNPQSSKRLAIQFSETDPVEVSPAFGEFFLSGLDEFVEGVC